MTQQTSSETLEEIAERIALEVWDEHGWSGANPDLPIKRWNVLFVQALITDPAILDHIPAVKALREAVREREALSESRLEQMNADRKAFNNLRDELVKVKSQLAELRQGGEAVAYLTLNECGDPAMLFFDQAEAATYCSEGVDSIPLYTCPQPAIPPGYVVVKSELFEAVAALVRFAGDWNQGTHAKLYRPVICRLVGEHISNAPAIQSQAAAPSVPVAEKALPENVKLLLLKAHRQLETEYRQQTRATEAKRVANATCGESPGGASSIALLAESGYISSIGKRNQEVRDEIFAMLAAPADSKEGE